jgi:hypothetical protein
MNGVGPPPWRRFLDAHFPGYLLPEAAVNALSVGEAAKFLAALSGRPDQLEVVRASTTLAPHAEALKRFVLVDLTELVRVLPSRTETQTKLWSGGFVGRLDVSRTSVLHSQGATNSFVTRTRRRRFDPPENILLRWVTERLLAALTLLRRAGVLAPSGWSAALLACEATLQRLLLASVLREVPSVRPGAYEEQAARAARHPAYRSAVRWLEILREGLDSTDPAVVARVVARGALEPLKDFTQFEIAVLLRLAVTLYETLELEQPACWRLHRTLISRDRDEVFVLERDDGARVRLFYNRAELPSGACDRGIKHYLANHGRMRPDITIITDLPGRPRSRATVLEMKLSDSAGYLVEGYQQATVYRWEYADALTGWPKAILVVPSAVSGVPRAEDDVIAVGWSTWMDRGVMRNLLDEVLATTGAPASP